ncbi:MAG TPA: homogentisate 1,2-dioxygenase, partial [Runella sp.]|nr:homogentisate 1,2-dioxygenase [Runella sp.]
MPIYHKLGKIPPKRHTQFRKPDGGLYYEQLFGTIGFDGMSALMYHVHRPTMIREVLSETDVNPKIAVSKSIKPRLLKGFELTPEDDFLASRKVLLANADIHIGLAAPRQSLRSYFYKNADADELIFVHQGTGTLR